MGKRKRPWWDPILHLVGHPIIGAATFIVLCAASIGLSLLMQAVETNVELPPLTLLALTVLEDAIVLVDAVLFAVYFAAAAVRAFWEIL